MFRGLLLLRVLFVAACLFVAGCGNDDPTGPKTSLDDKEKQQIEELNQQRESEWGPSKSARKNRN